MPAAHFELRAVVQDKNVVPTRRRAACIDPIKVDYRAAMNAVEFLRIEVLLDAFHSRPSSVDHAGRVNLNIIGSRGEIVDLIDRGHNCSPAQVDDKLRRISDGVLGFGCSVRATRALQKTHILHVLSHNTFFSSARVIEARIIFHNSERMPPPQPLFVLGVW